MNRTSPSDVRMPPMAGLLLAGLVVNVLLILPAWWRDGALGSVWIAPEAWLMPALVVLFPGRRARGSVRVLLTALLALAIVAGFFDGLVRSLLSRPLNVFVDPLMLGAGFSLLEGSFGIWVALAAAVLVAIAAGATVWAAWRLLAPPIEQASSGARAIGVSALLVALPGVSDRIPGVDPQVPGLIAEQAAQFDRTRRARHDLLKAENDPAFQARALPGLAGRDVYVVFVESYGTSALDQPRYATRLQPVLKEWDQRLAERGLRSVTSRLRAPIRGGQSWLSHASLLSGLAVDNQLWYRMMLARDVDLLSHDFRATGHVALNIVPGIVDDWPEGRQLGFDRIYAAGDMGYRGPSLGWVTMPDEFTLHALTHRIRPRYSEPIFAQVALISSHWPWQPVIERTRDVANIGAGEIYERWSGESAEPLELLMKPTALRAAYTQSLGYTLSVVFAWAERSLPDKALLIVLGDHQPTSVITGRDVSAAVPVHVISGDGGLLRPFARRGFEPGLDSSRVRRSSTSLHRLRHWIRADFGADRSGSAE